LQATKRSLSIIKALDELGVTVSLDVFGTGYSSLSVLRDLSIKCIKIDRSFVIDLPANEGQRAVVEAIVALSRALHMSITVEGIERPEQADMLQALGCQRGQGLFFGRPMAFAELASCLSSALTPTAGL
jgi:EAL domain-containing protein (putative c-di-GMP-specific phosphodiesterase class I)